jgi:hypothetical protein
MFTRQQPIDRREAIDVLDPFLADDQLEASPSALNRVSQVFRS